MNCNLAMEVSGKFTVEMKVNISHGIALCIGNKGWMSIQQIPNDVREVPCNSEIENSVCI